MIIVRFVRSIFSLLTWLFSLFTLCASAIRRRSMSMLLVDWDTHTHNVRAYRDDDGLIGDLYILVICIYIYIYIKIWESCVRSLLDTSYHARYGLLGGKGETNVSVKHKKQRLIFIHLWNEKKKKTIYIYRNLTLHTHFFILEKHSWKSKGTRHLWRRHEEFDVPLRVVWRGIFGDLRWRGKRRIALHFFRYLGEALSRGSSWCAMMH